MRHCAQPVGTIVKPQATPFQGTKIPNIISTTCRRHFPCRSNTQCEGRAREDHPLIEDDPQPPAGPQQLPCQRKSKWRGSILETSSRAIISTSLAYLKKALYHTRTSGQDVVAAFREYFGEGACSSGLPRSPGTRWPGRAQADSTLQSSP